MSYLLSQTWWGRVLEIDFERESSVLVKCRSNFDSHPMSKTFLRGVLLSFLWQTLLLPPNAHTASTCISQLRNRKGHRYDLEAVPEKPLCFSLPCGLGGSSSQFLQPIESTQTSTRPACRPLPCSSRLECSIQRGRLWSLPHLAGRGGWGRRRRWDPHTARYSMTQRAAHGHSMTVGEAHRILSEFDKDQQSVARTQGEGLGGGTSATR